MAFDFSASENREALRFTFWAMNYSQSSKQENDSTAQKKALENVLHDAVRKSRGHFHVTEEQSTFRI